jgi:hypothetical protein
MLMICNDVMRCDAMRCGVKVSSLFASSLYPTALCRDPVVGLTAFVQPHPVRGRQDDGPTRHLRKRDRPRIGLRGTRYHTVPCCLCTVPYVHIYDQVCRMVRYVHTRYVLYHLQTQGISKNIAGSSKNIFAKLRGKNSRGCIQGDGIIFLASTRHSETRFLI